MDKCFISCFSLTVIALSTAGVPQEICELCLPVRQCSIFSNLGPDEYRSLVKRYPCTNQPDDSETPPSSLKTNAGSEYVCCPNQIPNQLLRVKSTENIQRLNPELSSRLTEANQFRNLCENSDTFANQNVYPNTDYNKYRQNNDYGSANNNYGSAYDEKNAANDRYNFQTNKQWSSENSQRPISGRNNGYLNPTRWSMTTKKFWNDRPDKTKWDVGNQVYFQGNNNDRRRSQFDSTNRNFGNIQGDGKNNYGNNQKTGGYDFNTNNYSRKFPQNGQNGNAFRKSGQCVTRLPPNPEGGCCGLEASDDDRITGTPFKLSDNNQLQTKLTKTIDGGKETDLTQYPWTALVLATFDNGLQRTSFNCGGALISSRFVLTAGHCLQDDETRLKSVQVYLAEFDKRTFPYDCKMTGEGRKCVENLAIYAEDVIIHPQFLESRLLNDIALLRLQKDAPYTDYIRPICLPSINVDNPEHARLPLTVAGWGRDGEYKTDVKQFTTVHLVPQNGCRRFYPDLTPRHLCAAGYTGQDTCKGDSGGPLMTKYQGKYYIEGVVSGKRKDAPCGSAVPSLYTNVYHYLDWIRSNINN